MVKTRTTYIVDSDGVSWELIGLVGHDWEAEGIYDTPKKYREDTYNPESKPPSFNPHGLANDDCDTVWFLGLKWKMT